MCAYHATGIQPWLFSFTNGFKDFTAFVSLSDFSIGFSIVRFLHLFRLHVSLHKSIHFVICRGKLAISIRFTKLLHLVLKGFISSHECLEESFCIIHLFYSSDEALGHVYREMREFSFSTFSKSSVSFLKLCFLKCLKDRRRNIGLVDLLPTVFNELFRGFLFDTLFSNLVAFIKKGFTKVLVLFFQSFDFSLKVFRPIISLLHVILISFHSFLLGHTFVHIGLKLGFHVIRHFIKFVGHIFSLGSITFIQRSHCQRIRRAVHQRQFLKLKLFQKVRQCSPPLRHGPQKRRPLVHQT